ncbi:hypothetical protein D3C74_487630 [compost metagenome]
MTGLVSGLRGGTVEFDVQYARRVIGTFEEGAEADKVQGFVLQHGAQGHSA